MGNRGSVFDKYKAAIDKGTDIPPPTTFNHQHGRDISVCKKVKVTQSGIKDCVHPYKLLYGNSDTAPPTKVSCDKLPHRSQGSLYPPYVRKVKFDFANDDEYPGPAYSECHPYRLDFDRNLKTKKTPEELRIHGNISVYPTYCRKIKFFEQDDPSLRIDEWHPYKLDFGCNITKTSRTHILPSEPSDSVRIQPTKRRAVGFDNDKDPKEAKSEKHPFLIDFGKHVLSRANIYLKNEEYHSVYGTNQVQPTKRRSVGFDEDKEPKAAQSEQHPFFLDFGIHPIPNTHIHLKNEQFNSLYRYFYGSYGKRTPIQFLSLPSDIPEDIENPKTWLPTKVHFTICRQVNLNCKKMLKKRIYKHSKNRETPKRTQKQGNEILHKSIVAASHFFWTLNDMKCDSMAELQVAEEEDIETEVSKWSGIDEMCLYSTEEVHPLHLAKHSANCAILKDGCPPVGRLNKMPHISFKEPFVEECISAKESLDGNGETLTLSTCTSYKNDSNLENNLQMYDLQTPNTTEIPIYAHKLLKGMKTSKWAFKTTDMIFVQRKNLVVTLDAICDESLITDYLSEILDNRFSFTISHVVQKNGHTECIAEFLSKGAAERFKRQLNKLSKDTKCSAKFQENQIDTKVNANFLQNEWAVLMKETQSPLSSHQLKIKEITQTIKNKKKKQFSVADVESALNEIQALEQKLKEYNNQREEYEDFLCTLDSEFKLIETHSNVSSVVNKMKECFTIEKERLETCLPMYGCKREIIEMVSKNQVSILLGETGSGKSTQVAQYLYEAGLGELGMIACTQPRKVAAIILAKRVAQEMHTKVGHLVGFKVGMQKDMSRDTALLYMTDHMLLKECLSDPYLTKYSCIIIDEAHERSINTDLLLGMIKKSLPHRSDLRVIVTSATINPDVFVRFFNGCPILKVSGRVFPVEVVYSSSQLSLSADYLSEAVAKAISISENEGPGDILVFLTTPLETEKACEKSKRLNGKNSKVISLALHGKTQSSDLQKVFEPTSKGKRKIVFATNSAETSITIPGIKYVVDTGLAKEMQYDPSKSMSALKVTGISKSSANQRKGRAGRTSVGKCYRLYSEKDYAEMRESTPPEILRVHLGMAILELLSLSVDPFSFDFVEAPSDVALDKASEVLQFIGATEDGKLTELGRKLSKLSLEPRLGKLVLRGVEENIAYESVLVASFSAMGGNMFFRGGSDENKDLADKLKVRFCHFNGDFHTMLNVFQEWDLVPEKDKNKWCLENSINAKSMRMARDAAKEIMNTLSRDLGITVKRKYANDARFVENGLDSLMLEMFTTNVCLFSGHERLGYIVITDQRILHIHPSSALKSLGKLPNMLVFENTLQTSRAFMLNVTCISDESSKYLKGEKIEGCLEKCRSQIVHPAIIENIGRSTLLGLIGKKFSILKSLEGELQAALKSKLVVLDASVDNSNITIYAQKEHHTTATTLISEVIEKERALMSLEEIERPLVETSPVRAIIGEGGGIKHLLFANEFRSIMIHDIPYPETAESIMEMFREIGIVSDFHTNVKKEKKQPWVKIVFENPAVAKEALLALEDETNLIDIELKAKPDLTGTHGLRPAKPPEIQLKLTWCRRPLTGIAFVKFNEFGLTSSDETIAQTVASRIQTIYIEGAGMRPARVSLSKKNREELFLANVPKDALHQATVNRIKGAIEDVCGIEPADVVLPREKNVPPTSKSDVQQFKRLMENAIINDGVDVSDLRIHMPVPHEKSFEYMAFVYVPNNAYIGNIEQALDRLTIMGNKVHVKMIMKSSIMILQHIYPYVEYELNDVIVDLEEEFGDSIDIKGKQLRSQMYVINIQSESVEDMVYVRKKLSKIIDGKTVEIPDKKVLSYFGMNLGQSFLNKLQRKHHVYIQLDYFRHSLHIHGSEHDMQNSIKAIKKQVEYLSELEEKSFKLCDLYPAGMSKLLISKYGIYLETFSNDTHVDYVDLKLRTHTLYVRGNSKAISSTEKLLKLISNLLMEKAPDQKEKEMPDCAVCFCPIDYGDVYRLECCGHPYCKECVKNLFLHAIRDKDFPIKCATEDCGKKIAVKDIFGVIGNTMSNLQPLLESAIDRYVSANTETLKYCITPNCAMVYKATKEMNIEVCSLCCMRICTNCHCQFHEGLTCERYQSMDTDDQDFLEEWLSEDPQNRALCPKCGSGIEKAGGCQHMNCSVCKIHICWRCKKTFNTEQETYTHLAKQCGGIF